MKVREIITTLIESAMDEDVVVSIGNVGFDIEKVEDWDARVKIFLKIRNEKEERKTREIIGKEYIPVCPKGFTDCVCDPAYIKYIDPEWYNELYGDLTPQEAADRDCTEEDDNCYDDEDK